MKNGGKNGEVRKNSMFPEETQKEYIEKVKKNLCMPIGIFYNSCK